MFVIANGCFVPTLLSASSYVRPFFADAQSLFKIAPEIQVAVNDFKPRLRRGAQRTNGLMIVDLMAFAQRQVSDSRTPAVVANRKKYLDAVHWLSNDEIAYFFPTAYAYIDDVSRGERDHPANRVQTVEISLPNAAKLITSGTADANLGTKAQSDDMGQIADARAAEERRKAEADAKGIVKAKTGQESRWSAVEAQAAEERTRAEAETKRIADAKVADERAAASVASEFKIAPGFKVNGGTPGEGARSSDINPVSAPQTSAFCNTRQARLATAALCLTRVQAHLERLSSARQRAETKYAEDLPNRGPSEETQRDLAKWHNELAGCPTRVAEAEKTASAELAKVTRGGVFSQNVAADNLCNPLREDRSNLTSAEAEKNQSPENSAKESPEQLSPGPINSAHKATLDRIASDLRSDKNIDLIMVDPAFRATAGSSYSLDFDSLQREAFRLCKIRNYVPATPEQFVVGGPKTLVLNDLRQFRLQQPLDDAIVFAIWKFQADCNKPIRHPVAAYRDYVLGKTTAAKRSSLNLSDDLFVTAARFGSVRAYEVHMAATLYYNGENGYHHGYGIPPRQSDQRLGPVSGFAWALLAYLKGSEIAEKVILNELLPNMSPSMMEYGQKLVRQFGETQLATMGTAHREKEQRAKLATEYFPVIARDDIGRMDFKSAKAFVGGEVEKIDEFLGRNHDLRHSWNVSEACGGPSDASDKYAFDLASGLDGPADIAFKILGERWRSCLSEYDQLVRYNGAAVRAKILGAFAPEVSR